MAKKSYKKRPLTPTRGSAGGDEFGGGGDIPPSKFPPKDRRKTLAKRNELATRAPTELRSEEDLVAALASIPMAEGNTEDAVFKRYRGKGPGASAGPFTVGGEVQGQLEPGFSHYAPAMGRGGRAAAAEAGVARFPGEAMARAAAGKVPGFMAKWGPKLGGAAGILGIALTLHSLYKMTTEDEDDNVVERMRRQMDTDDQSLMDSELNYESNIARLTSGLGASEFRQERDAATQQRVNEMELLASLGDRGKALSAIADRSTPGLAEIMAKAGVL